MNRRGFFATIVAALVRKPDAVLEFNSASFGGWKALAALPPSVREVVLRSGAKEFLAKWSDRFVGSGDFVRRANALRLVRYKNGWNWSYE